ncbi:uncharacterized protein BYT42DRAFT_615348 [Radiomyces spectabilis]|uniref:uncharacterized protein n=1 Tax=Radiomyces spectabilis TaxID=64574 RepID=UPI00221ECB64|nr:uncharacterized protein BYT42DRAFT_615348 [Radiomyces spectabilis]KAI8374165.1 hypothetical protein BYT42DRAFT_615348 [Radiomyces spectabilis]
MTGLGAAEASENNDDDKVTKNNARLLREGKDIVDRLLLTLVEPSAPDKMKDTIIQSACTKYDLLTNVSSWLKRTTCEMAEYDTKSGYRLFTPFTRSNYGNITSNLKSKITNYRIRQ